MSPKPSVRCFFKEKNVGGNPTKLKDRVFLGVVLPRKQWIIIWIYAPDSCPKRIQLGATIQSREVGVSYWDFY
jgi:hypothetical protein